MALRYDAKTLEIKYRGKNIAEVLAMTVDAACDFFAEEPHVSGRSMSCGRSASATCGSGSRRPSSPGGEAQRIKLATELQRTQRGDTLYILDEPTTGLHPADVEKLMAQLDGIVDAGNTVIVVEHDMRVAAGSEWVIDRRTGRGRRGRAYGGVRDACRGLQIERKPYRSLPVALHRPAHRKNAPAPDRP